METHITPGIQDAVSMLEGIEGLDGLTVFRHVRGGNNGVNTRGSMSSPKSDKIKWGPNGERAPVIVTKVGDSGTISRVLIEVTHDDDILVGIVYGILSKVLKQRRRIFNGGVY